MLGDISKFLEWRAQIGLPAWIERSVQVWIAGLGTNSAQYPSIPLALMSETRIAVTDPQSEIREAELLDCGGVVVVYKVYYSTTPAMDGVEIIGIIGP